MNQELFKKQLCNQGGHVHYEKYRRFLLCKTSRATITLMLFTVSKDEWNTKEDTGKCIAHTVVYQKAPLGLKQC